MDGKIKIFNETRNFGFILGEDGEDYFFHLSEIKFTEKIIRGLHVKFIPMESDKGKVAISITINIEKKSQSAKPTFILFNDTRIKFSNIKNYGISTETFYYAKVYEYTSDCGFFKQIFDPYKWNGLLVRISKESYDSYCHHPQDYKRFVKTSSGEIKQTKYERYMENGDCISKDIKYLYITTYQKDNHVFYENEFNINKKIKEIDEYMI